MVNLLIYLIKSSQGNLNLTKKNTSGKHSGRAARWFCLPACFWRNDERVDTSDFYTVDLCQPGAYDHDSSYKGKIYT